MDVLESIVESGWESVGESPDPIEVMPNQVEREIKVPDEPSSVGREIEVPDEPSSVGRTLIRSLGGFVWVIVLIGFTLARNCGGE